MSEVEEAEHARRITALEEARAAASAAVEAWVAATPMTVQACQSDARRALASVLEARKHLADFAAWSVSPEDQALRTTKPG